MSASKTLLLAMVFHGAAVMAFAQPVILITPTNTTWRYFTNGADPGAGWALPGFDDNAWPQGRGLFGTEITNVYPYEFATVIPLPRDGGPLTSYFRTHFPWNGGPFGVVFTGTNHVDDGCVVYLNGVEITRFNMPPCVPEYSTLAPVANPGGFPNLSGGEPVVVRMQISLDNLTNGNANPLVNGDNVLAVEVHQNASTTSDVVFGLSLFAQQCVGICLDGIQPTNRTVLEGRSTTFIIVQSAVCCGGPFSIFQWYRNVGFGEELIVGATSTSYTLTNAMLGVDEGVYYCRLSSASGVADSRQAVLMVLADPDPPRFLSASAVGPGLNTFRLTTDEDLCGDALACGSDYSLPTNWDIVPADDPAISLGVAAVRRTGPMTYEFITMRPRNPARLYRIAVATPLGEIGDLAGNWAPPGTFAETLPVLTFQQGDINGYTGTHDAEIHSNASADTPLGNSLVMKCDLDDAGVAQSLLRFDNIVGFSPGQIPPGVRIRLATLTLQQIDPGVAVNLHRMLVPWDQTTVTWNSLTEGITADDVEASTVADATIPARSTNGPVELDVTSSVQVWANGQPNRGWALLSTGVDGWTFNTSESGASTAPLLIVELGPIDECNPVITRQPPPTLVIIEGQSVSISAEVLNPFGLVFQWTKDGVEIPGATSPAYSIQNARLMDSGTYRLRIVCESNPSTSVTSGPTVVTVLGDDTRVHLTGAVAHVDGTRVTLRFSKPLLDATARNPANYQFAPPLAVMAVAHTNQTSSASVALTTAPGELGANYVLRIANLRDTRSAGNPIDPNPTLIPLTSARVILPWDADGWLYNTNNLDATPDWKNPNFTPGPDWRTGCGLFGGSAGIGPLIPEPGFICTPLLPNNVPAESELRVTTYFRRTVELPVLPAGTRYVICHYADDGFIAYLDGAEIYRFAMPAGAVTFTNRSTGIPTGNATMRSFSFTATPGEHTLAVELHQAGVTSSDVLFGMEVRIVGGIVPSLSIAHSVNADINLNWDADDSWRLRSASVLAGPYLDVAIPAGTRLGAFTLPRASATNGNQYYRLDYLCRP